MLKRIKAFAALTVVLGAGMFAGQAQAATVTCGGPSGIRVTVIDPGLTGGLCATGIGNLTNAGIAALGLTEVDKDVVTDSTPSGVAGGDNAEGSLFWSQVAGGRSGSWTVAPSAWSTYEQVYLGFHFGGGDNQDPCVALGTCGGNPDWFVVELARADLTGSWDLNPDILSGQNNTNGALSNIYLLSKGVCVTNCGGGIIETPEPASLALVGLALLGVGFASRRKQQ